MDKLYVAMCRLAGDEWKAMSCHTDEEEARFVLMKEYSENQLDLRRFPNITKAKEYALAYATVAKVVPLDAGPAPVVGVTTS